MTSANTGAELSAAPVAELRGVTKAFSGVVAVKDIDLPLRPGNVVALLGENGAGKSTLMKILSGVYDPTSGEIVVDNEAYSSLTPAQARDLGIAIIYQELSVINQLSIAENIFLGRLPKRGGLVDWGELYRSAQSMLDDYGIRRDARQPLGEISVSEKQMVEVLKATAGNARVIVMDEPTTSLTESEVQILFDLIRRLKADGASIAFISHKLKEVFAIADEVVVLRDGAITLRAPISEVTEPQLVRAMVGRELEGRAERPEFRGEEEQRPLLQVHGLTRRDNKVVDANLELRAGEILALSGLVGAGRSELVEAIYGAVPASGEITVFGRPARVRSTYDGLNLGMSLVTEDRRGSGIFKNFDISKNVVIAKGLKKSRWGGLLGWLRPGGEDDEAKRQQGALNIKCRNVGQNITELSGGNQQKVLIGRALSAGSDIIILDEPTKGIDVGAKAEIYSILRELCADGVGVLIVSSDLPEVLSVSDRVLVMREGRIVGEVMTEATSEEELVALATGSSHEGSAA